MACIRARNGKYQIVVSNGIDINGKPIQETATFIPPPDLKGRKLEKAVQEFARKFEEQVKDGLVMEGRKITLKVFVDRWLVEYAPQNLDPGTLEDYKLILNDRILPVLGHLKMTELRPPVLNAFSVSLTRDGVRKDGKKGGYSKSTIKKTNNVLSSVLRTATEWEVIDRNPLEKVRVRAEDPADKIKFFTPEEASTFLAYIEEPYIVKTKGHSRIDDTGKEYAVDDYELKRELPEQLKVLFILAIYGGLRKGELLALEWSDIDFDANTVSIMKSVSVVGNMQIVKAPKTKNSRRVVVIPSFLTQRMRKMKIDRTKYRLSLGDYWQGAEWLFIQQNGLQMNYATPYAAFKDTIARYNQGKPKSKQLPNIPFHGLRHTSATLMIAMKQDVPTVSSRLGHAQASTTMNIYAHALKELDHKASDALEIILSKKA